MNRITNLKTFLEFAMVLASLIFLCFTLAPKVSSPESTRPWILPSKPKPPNPKNPSRPVLPIFPLRDTDDLFDTTEKQNPSNTIKLGGKLAPDNKTEIQIDFPLSEHIINIGSKKDGAGMCVMSSIEMAARWSNLESMRGLRDWCAKEPGGGWPEKVDRQMIGYNKAHQLSPAPGYIQYEGKDLQILKTALDTGRFPAITYSGRDKVRYTGTIAHMVCLAHLDEKYAAIWDNNGKPGELIWMSPKEFVDRWTDGSSGWTFIWISPPPPPIPIP